MKHLPAALFAALLCAVSPAWAGRPLTIDDADPTPAGQGQLTAGFGWEHSGSYQDWDYPLGLAYGLAPSLEVNTSLGACRAEVGDTDDSKQTFGLGDFLLGAKWQFSGETAWLPRQTLEPSIKIPTASHRKGIGSGRPDYDLTWVASKKVGEAAQVDVNVGYTRIGHSKDEPENDVLHGGMALEYQLCDNLQWVGEVFAARNLRNDGQLAVLSNTGVRWQVEPYLTLDVAIGTGLRGENAPHLTGMLGLSWSFDVTRK